MNDDDRMTIKSPVHTEEGKSKPYAWPGGGYGCHEALAFDAV